jgi:hypothetical protein
MYAKKQTHAKSKPGCSYCRSLGKSESEWTSHFIHKTPSQNSRLTCPELLKRVCPNCSSQNHTYDKCKRRSESDYQSASSKPAAVVCVPAKNRYSDLCEEVDIAQLLSFDPNVLPTLSHEDQINYIGEEVYARVAVNDPLRASMITGILLELQIPELVSMLGDPEKFQMLVGEATRILVEAK